MGGPYERGSLRDDLYRSDREVERLKAENKTAPKAVPLASDDRIGAIYELSEMMIRYRPVLAGGEWRVMDKVAGGLVFATYTDEAQANAGARLLAAQDILDKLQPREGR